MKILVATRNPGKLREYAALLTGSSPDDEPVEWVSLSDLAIKTEVNETGATLEENARLKAVTYAQESGLLTLADDSGLEVDALGGAPGVHSARFGRPGLNDAGRYQLLLEKLDGVPDAERSARFRCVVAICTPQGGTYTAQGVCEGRITHSPRGEHGFGYDPVFWVEGRGATMAELPPEVKNQISHRAQALKAIKPLLAKLLAGQV
jgi:XTP/dITP diphosphohydrolase